MIATLLFALSLPAFAEEPPPELLALEEALLPEVMERDLEMYERLRDLRDRDLQRYAAHLHELNERLERERDRQRRAEAGLLREAELQALKAEEAMRAIEREARIQEAEMQAVEALLRARALAWQASDDRRDRAQIEREIEGLVEEMFDLRIALKTQQIERMREQLSMLEAELADHSERRDELIQQFMDEKFSE